MLLVLWTLGCADADRVGEVLALTPDNHAGGGEFSTNCTGCHGDTGEGGSGPSLLGIGLTERAVVEKVLGGGLFMPPLDGELEDYEIRDIAAYVVEDLNYEGPPRG